MATTKKVTTKKSTLPLSNLILSSKNEKNHNIEELHIIVNSVQFQLFLFFQYVLNQLSNFIFRVSQEAPCNSYHGSIGTTFYHAAGLSLRCCRMSPSRSIRNFWSSCVNYSNSWTYIGGINIWTIISRLFCKFQAVWRDLLQEILDCSF